MSEDQVVHKPESAFTLFTKSKELVIANINTYAVLLLIPLAVNIIASLSTNGSGTSLGSFGVGGVGLGSVGMGAGFGLLSLIVSIFVSLFTYALNNEVAKNKKPQLAELWPVVKKFGWRLVGLSLLIGLLFGFGLILLIVPGLIVLRRYLLAPYVMLDQDLGITAAMEESARISKPYSGAVWGVIGVSFLCAVVAIVPLIGWIISFVLTGLYQVATGLRYYELKKLVGKA